MQCVACTDTLSLPAVQATSEAEAENMAAFMGKILLAMHSVRTAGGAHSPAPVPAGREQESRAVWRHCKVAQQVAKGNIVFPFLLTVAALSCVLAGGQAAMELTVQTLVTARGPQGSLLYPCEMLLAPCLEVLQALAPSAVAGGPSWAGAAPAALGQGQPACIYAAQPSRQIPHLPASFPSPCSLPGAAVAGQLLSV